MGEELDHLCAPGDFAQAGGVAASAECGGGVHCFQPLRIGGLCSERSAGPGGGPAARDQAAAAVRLGRSAAVRGTGCLAAVAGRGRSAGVLAVVGLYGSAGALPGVDHELLMATETNGAAGCLLP